MDWINVPGHIIFLLCFFVCIVVGEGIIITILLKDEKKQNYGKGKIASKIPMLRRFWGPFVVYAIATSIISLFIASFVSKQNITLYDMNTWVSLILGMTALIIGVISLFLSFYNVDQSIDSQRDSLEIMNTVKEDIEEKLNEIEKMVEKGFRDIHDDIDKYHSEATMMEKNKKPDQVWGEF